MFIPRVLVFDKIDGRCLVNTGTILLGGRKIKTDDEIISSYTELKNMVRDNILIYREIMIRL